MFLGIIVIGPWLLLLVYDMILYVFRTATYDIPYVGGRARNRPRPRAPSLSERPSGRARTFSLTVPGVSSTVDGAEETIDGLKKRLSGNGHERSGSNVMIDD
jgi:hypothetical protein